MVGRRPAHVASVHNPHLIRYTQSMQLVYISRVHACVLKLNNRLSVVVFVLLAQVRLPAFNAVVGGCGK